MSSIYKYVDIILCHVDIQNVYVGHYVRVGRHMSTSQDSACGTVEVHFYKIRQNSTAHACNAIETYSIATYAYKL